MYNYHSITIITPLRFRVQSGGSPDKRLAEMQKTLETAEKELEKAKQESGRAAAETERLLQLVQMTQEEQNSKEKEIRQLQEYVTSSPMSKTYFHIYIFLLQRSESRTSQA